MVNAVRSEFLGVILWDTAAQVGNRIAGTEATQRKLLPNRMTLTRHTVISNQVSWVRNAEETTRSDERNQQDSANNDEASGCPL